LNKREINLKVVQYELVVELIEYLSEHAYTCFFTNYFLEYNGKALDEYVDLSSIGLTQDDNKIYMRTKQYDQKSCRAHIQKVNDIFTKPSVLNMS
jgi:hypothetical protein